MRERLINLAFRLNGSYYKLKREYERLFEQPLTEGEQIAIRETEEHLNRRGISCLTYLDKGYPKHLTNLPQPPLVLFYRGRIELLEERNLLYLSGDYLSARTEEALIRSEGALSEDSVLVTRGWLSFESRAAKSYIESEAPIIFVSVTGLTRFERGLKDGVRFNPEQHLVISEAVYPVEPAELRQRNRAAARLCAGLSRALIIFSIERDSGLRYLVDRFLEVGKEVFCFSGRPRAVEEAEEQLISWGATRVDRIETS